MKCSKQNDILCTQWLHAPCTRHLESMESGLQ